MLFRSVDDRMVTDMLPKTYKAMEQWDGKELPSEEVFEGFYLDYKKLVEEKTFGKLATQLNFTKNGCTVGEIMLFAYMYQMDLVKPIDMFANTPKLKTHIME